MPATALQTALRSYVNSNRPGKLPKDNDNLADEMAASGKFYLDSGSVLCVRADSVSASSLATGNGTTFVTLPTRVSAAANTTLTALRELFNCGVFTSSGLKLHEQDPGVTMQVIP